MTTAITPTTAQPTQLKNSKFELKAEDFIKMMVTQLQNQDPTQPARNEELLAQMSQIGQLQSATSLQQSLKVMVLQNQISSAGGLIGKLVAGINDFGESVRGLVNSVRVEKDNVVLELDNGESLQLNRVTQIGAGESAAAAST